MDFIPEGPGVAKWVLLFVIYVAPADAVDWDGPWEAGNKVVREELYDSEQECRAGADELKAQIHEAIRAPLRYSCVQIEGSLPEGAPR